MTCRNFAPHTSQFTNTFVIRYHPWRTTGAVFSPKPNQFFRLQRATNVNNMAPSSGTRAARFQRFPACSWNRQGYDERYQENKRKWYRVQGVEVQEPPFDTLLWTLRASRILSTHLPKAAREIMRQKNSSQWLQATWWRRQFSMFNVPDVSMTVG
jgi:hypothetical protein